MKNRNQSIDILKFLAVLLITHSHMELAYGNYSFLCTGGAIGDALFFFISGFTLFIGEGNSRFDNWYKRRINRIYPTVFAWAFITCLLFNRHWDFLHIIKYGGGAFVTCIMVCYIVFYPIKKYFIKHLVLLMGVLTLSILVYFFFFCRNKSIIFAATSEMWPMWCFSMMMFGSMIGLKSKNTQTTYSALNPYKEFGKCICCLIVFYAIYISALNFNMDYITIIALLPLYGVVYYLYRLCNCTVMLTVYNKNIAHQIIYWCGSLCLEVYLVQYVLFTDKWNYLFPLNIVGLWVAIFVLAYTLKIFSNFFSQTFKDAEYDWKKVITL